MAYGIGANEANSNTPIRGGRWIFTNYNKITTKSQLGVVIYVFGVVTLQIGVVILQIWERCLACMLM
jgi:hypothetical protein